MRTGLQISSLKKYIQTPADFASTLRRVREMGYRDVQLQWTGEAVTCEFIAEQLERNGMTCWGTQDYYDAVMGRMDYEIRAGRLYHSKYICLSGIPERFMSEEGVLAMAAEMRGTGARLADEGYILTFHPRYHEYARFGSGETAAERLLDNAPDLQLTLDAYHSAMAGVDSAALMRKYAGRVDMVHLKDAAALTPDAPLTPIGAGAIDFKPVFDTCETAGVKVVFAEQERWQRDPFECMKQSLEYMRQNL